MYTDLEDTISAISTPLGMGAISIIRLSGKNAIEIANSFFSKDIKNFKSHTLHYGKILNRKKEVVDTVMLSIMLAPKTYTGEDIIEVHCHGGSFITKKVFETTLEAGARAAAPGEFTYRAFLNKKMDLTQAESIQDLIKANNDVALKYAKKNLEGDLFKEIKSYQKELTDIVGVLEASLDYPEEDLELFSFDTIKESLATVLDKMKNLSSSYEDGKTISEDKSLCIIGSPNVGKSSLMNTLLKEDRAIVTDIAGTTRDILEKRVKINNFYYNLIDTAGLRKTNELIEKEGIKKTKKAIEQADICLLVLDATKSSLSEDDKELLEMTDEEKTIVVFNKIDLKKPTVQLKNFSKILKISAKEKTNIEELKKEIEKISIKNPSLFNSEIILTSKRHKISLDDAIKNLIKASSKLKDNSAQEFITIDLIDSLNHLSNIIGSNVKEDILSSIFSNFCIGK